MKKDNEVKQQVNWQSFLQFIKGSNVPKGLLAIALTISVIETIAGLVVPVFTMFLVDELSTTSFQVSTILFLAAAFVVQTISAGFSFYLLSYIGEKIVASIRNNLWKHVLALPIPFFDQNESGETMSRLTQDTNTVKQLITSQLVSFITGIISIIGSVLILLYIDWRMTVILLLAVPLSLAIIIPLGRKMYKVSKGMQDEMAGFTANLGRVLSEIRLVKAYRAEEREEKIGEERINHLFQFGLKEAKIQAIISPFMTFIMMLVLVILIGYGGVRVASNDLTPGALVAIIIYMFQIVIPFSQMARFFTVFQKAMGATERIQTILSMDTEKRELSKEPFTLDPKADLTFERVTFSYSNGKTILHDVSFSVPSGKTTAFVGPSGAGKTTIFSLIERFYDPTSGNVKIGYQNVNDISLGEWRTVIGYVSQESPIMSGTIRENICYGLQRDVTLEEIKHAATLANASEFIEDLEDGYETEVGERGIKLSGGQRQRLAIARAFIRNPRILLLDEATSNLDSQSEVLVQQALQKLMTGRTTLVIAHRLSTVIDADQIIVLENGRVSGSGTHDELLAHHELYQKLATAQLRLED
ncbi:MULTISPECIES: ABC transporter ATP-binding protein [Bacillus]|uniref:ABC transporter ATP-binding protein n=1 Tax=Bacillus TaxID=1386 RepID=UPI000BB6F23F|nr:MULTISPECIES: ABC transporter ATP-binding protein [Bacillus]